MKIWFTGVWLSGEVCLTGWSNCNCNIINVNSFNVNWTTRMQVNDNYYIFTTFQFFDKPGKSITVYL